jgi:tRNA-intron endonuclease
MSKEKEPPISLEDINDDDIPEKIPTKFINNRVIVFNPLFASHLYVKQKFFGSPLGISKPRLEYFSKPSELSLIEALYLLKKEKITIFDAKSDKYLSPKEFTFLPKNFTKSEKKYIINLKKNILFIKI